MSQQELLNLKMQ